MTRRKKPAPISIGAVRAHVSRSRDKARVTTGVQ